MAKETNLHRPLVSDTDGSDDFDDVEVATPAWDKVVSGGPPHDNPNKRIKRIALLVSFACATITSFGGGMLVQSYRHLDRPCAEHTTQWSPLLRDVSLDYTVQSFNGSFMDEDIYRKEGSPEVDAAWEALGVNYRAGVISVQDGLDSGLDSSFVQRADKYGGGFLVNVEGMHHLHCLNLVRQALYFNYDRYKDMGTHAFKNEEHIVRLHITHCLDTVRQVLMCNADTGVLGQVWVYPHEPIAFPDFNTRHVCKNYDEIRQWAEKLQAPPFDDIPDDYLASPSPKDVLEKMP